MLLTGTCPLVCKNEGFPECSVGKESACNAGDPGLILGSGRFAGEGIGYPLQYSGLENFMDCIVHGVAKRQIRYHKTEAYTRYAKDKDK